MKETNYKIEGKSISYEVSNNGYSIYLDGVLWITQYDDYGKPMDFTKSYEENCIMQIEDMVSSFENTQNNHDDNSKMKAQIEYLAMMSDVDLTEIVGGEE